MNTDEPAQDAWDAYDRSFERMVSSDATINERIRQAFEAGYDARRTMRSASADWRPSDEQPGWSKDGRYKAYTIETRT